MLGAKISDAYSSAMLKQQWPRPLSGAEGAAGDADRGQAGLGPQLGAVAPVGDVGDGVEGQVPNGFLHLANAEGEGLGGGAAVFAIPARPEVGDLHGGEEGCGIVGREGR